ncbi:MAG: hypothetical protein PHS57_04155 [Alphaproteobacteria bacterium]|nr:hypothetical protein [Alphaproteobacteria bacterium]
MTCNNSTEPTNKPCTLVSLGCSQLGETRTDFDQQHIVACLCKDTANCDKANLVWKDMSEGSDGTCPAATVYTRTTDLGSDCENSYGRPGIVVHYQEMAGSPITIKVPETKNGALPIVGFTTCGWYGLGFDVMRYISVMATCVKGAWRCTVIRTSLNRKVCGTAVGEPVVVINGECPG